MTYRIDLRMWILKVRLSLRVPERIFGIRITFIHFVNTESPENINSLCPISDVRLHGLHEPELNIQPMYSLYEYYRAVLCDRVKCYKMLHFSWVPASITCAPQETAVHCTVNVNKKNTILHHVNKLTDNLSLYRRQNVCNASTIFKNKLLTDFVLIMNRISIISEY